MYVFLLVLVIFAAIAAVLFFEPVRISFSLDTDKPDMYARMRWLSFIGVDARLINYRLFITARLFSRKVAERFINKGNKSKSRYGVVKALALSDTRVKMAYGLNEPFLTGIFCAAADFAGALINNAGIELDPHFIPDQEFVRIKAATSLNLGKTFINLAIQKFRKQKGEKSMDNQLNLTENVDSLFRSLEDFTQREGIIGKPVTQGNKTFLPVVSITMGYGGGNANMKGQGGGTASSGSSSGATASSSTGTGAMGLGAKLCTDAVIVIDGQNVSVLPMNAAGASSSLVDKIPQIISGMKGQGQQGQAQNQASNQSANQSADQNQTPATAGKAF